MAQRKGMTDIKKKSEADKIISDEKSRYEIKKADLDKQEEATQSALSRLGKKELDIGESFYEFQTLASSLIDQLNEGKKNKIEINIPKHQIDKIEGYQESVMGILGTVTGAGATAAAAGFAVYGGVMALGAASTGTAISALSGVAATNATLAALGGGSLATGGLGIAGGTAVLGAAVAAPILAIAGWAYDNHGEKSLDKAHQTKTEIAQALKKIEAAQKLLRNTENYAHKILRSLSKIHRQFNKHFFKLQDIDKYLRDIKGRSIDEAAELQKHGDVITSTIEIGYTLAAILTDIITTPIFKIETINGEVQLDENGAPKIKRDSQGVMILNESALDSALSKAATDAEKYTE